AMEERRRTIHADRQVGAHVAASGRLAHEIARRHAALRHGLCDHSPMKGRIVEEGGVGIAPGHRHAQPRAEGDGKHQPPGHQPTGTARARWSLRPGRRLARIRNQARLPARRRASMVMLAAARRREIGQVFFAFSAAAWKAALSALGMSAVTSRLILVTVKPASVFSNVAVAVVSMRSALRLDSPSTAESAMEKQAACAAAISSSGFVPGAFSKRCAKL